MKLNDISNNFLWSWKTPKSISIGKMARRCPFIEFPLIMKINLKLISLSNSNNSEENREDEANGNYRSCFYRGPLLSKYSCSYFETALQSRGVTLISFITGSGVALGCLSCGSNDNSIMPAIYTHRPEWVAREWISYTRLW